MLNEPFCKECYFRSSCDGIVGGPQCATNASGTQPTSTNTQSDEIIANIKEVVHNWFLDGETLTHRECEILNSIVVCYKESQ